MKATTRIAMTLLLTLVLFGRATVSWSAPETPPKMRAYFLALLYKGPAWTPEQTPETARVQEGHMANIRRLAEEGKLTLAGPFEDAGDLRGLFVLDAGSIEEARALCATDPAIQAGRLRAEVYTWWSAEGVGVTPPRPSAAEAEAQIAQLEEQWNQAHLQGDVKVLENLWSDDLSILVPGMKPMTKGDALSAWKSAPVKFTRYETSDRQIQVHGDTAVVIGHLRRSRDFGGKVADDDWLYTKTYARTSAGLWQVMAFHASQAPGAGR
ncbi:MAG TPA: DUF4440 domain-containing protein [Thermoanaerobaculia bacterium]|nr:DUF4440 domain-containing protein [Thermoanaerobaculia bacterium]